MIRCYLAIDYGSRRIGLAAGDTQSGIASPLKTIEGTGTPRSDAAAVLRHGAQFDVDGFVIGLPLNMDGSEGPQARATRAFGDALAAASDKPIHYWDERLSSFAAEDLIQAEELTRKKKRSRVDRVAAQLILQEFLRAQQEPGKG
jgi:putative Holliday junction resolvase